MLTPEIINLSDQAIGHDTRLIYPHQSYLTCPCNHAQWLRERFKKLENEKELGPAQKFPEIQEIIEFAKPKLNGILKMDEETKKERRIKLFHDRTFFARDLVTIKEDGTKNFDDLIEHIKFLEECIKDLKTAHQAADLAKLQFIQEATVAERERIKATDKQYKPEFKERETANKEKLTIQEKKIRDFVKLGLSRQAAEQIIFGKDLKQNLKKEN